MPSVWSEREARADVLRGKLLVGAPLAPQAARAWVRDVCEALLKPERELGGRSTTGYSGDLTWDGRDAEGQFAGHAAWHTQDPDPEMVALLHDRKPQIAELARKSYAVAFAMDELAVRMGDIADAISGKRRWVDQAASYVSYFSHHADRQALFVPELEAARRIVALMRKDPPDAADAEQIVRELGAVDEQPHYDGSGWHGFRNAVRWWLEGRGAAL